MAESDQSGRGNAKSYLPGKDFEPFFQNVDLPPSFDTFVTEDITQKSVEIKYKNIHETITKLSKQVT